MTKIGFVGAGKIGSTSVYATLSMCEPDEIVLIDIPPAKDLVEGEAMDLDAAAPAFNKKTQVRGGTDYDLLRNSDIVVVSAGLPRKPGMTRLDLLQKNSTIIKDVAAKVKAVAPECVFILVSNPVDVLLSIAQSVLKFPRGRVIGMSSLHDSVRLTGMIREQTKDRSARGQILGEHGETMIAVPSMSRYPANAQIDWANIETAVRNRAMEVIQRKGATVFAPAASVARMVRAVMYDTKEEIASCVLPEGEYGLRDVSIGLPAVLGRNGLERIVEYPLNADEKRRLQASADSIRKNIKEAMAQPAPAPTPNQPG
jgi:malate dehydrogenase